MAEAYTRVFLEALDSNCQRLRIPPFGTGDPARRVNVPARQRAATTRIAMEQAYASLSPDEAEARRWVDGLRRFPEAPAIRAAHAAVGPSQRSLPYVATQIENNPLRRCSCSRQRLRACLPTQRAQRSLRTLTH